MPSLAITFHLAICLSALNESRMQLYFQLTGHGHVPCSSIRECFEPFYVRGHYHYQRIACKLICWLKQMLSVLYPLLLPSLSFSLTSGLYWVAITVYDLQMQHSSCAAFAFICSFSMTFRRTWQILRQRMHSIHSTHTHTQRHIDTLMHVWWVCGRWQSSSHECALVRPQRLV